MNRCMGCMQPLADMQAACPHCGYLADTPVKEAYHLPPGTILQGRYILGRVLGYGGFGVTYIGFDAQLERKVAIKEFLPATFATRLPGETALSVYQGPASEQFSLGLKRFIDEAQVLAQFNGVVGIVDIYDTIPGNNTGYIIMQYLQGQDLKGILNSQGVLDFEMAKDIIIQICDTLDPVHKQGIIHRDISPDNIFITDDGKIKLLDFGAARYESSLNSKSLSVILKSGYAPEEQYRSKGEQGSWTDVYALAATFYKILSGQTPPDSMERAIDDQLKDLSALNVQLPISAENAILNALAVRKADRTQTVAEFKAALQAEDVLRVKVTKPKAENSKMAKILIIASLIVLAGAAIISQLDGEEVISTPVVAEPAIVEEVQAVAMPDLSNLNLSEAAAMLEDLELKWQAADYCFSGEPLTEPRIYQQEIAVGDLTKAGDTIALTLDLGTYQQGVDGGYVPDLVGQNVVDVLYQLEQYQWLYQAEYRRFVDLSEDDQHGTLISQSDSDFTFGLGTNIGANTDYGQTRLAFGVPYSSTIKISTVYTIPRDGQYIDDGYRSLLVSADNGATYSQVGSWTDTVSWSGSGTGEAGRATGVEDFDLSKYFGVFSEQFDGQIVKLRIDRHLADGSLIDSVDVEGLYQFNAQEPVINIDSIEALSREEAIALDQSDNYFTPYRIDMAEDYVFLLHGQNDINNNYRVYRAVEIDGKYFYEDYTDNEYSTGYLNNHIEDEQPFYVDTADMDGSQATDHFVLMNSSYWPSIVPTQIDDQLVMVVDYDEPGIITMEQLKAII